MIPPQATAEQGSAETTGLIMSLKVEMTSTVLRTVSRTTTFSRPTVNERRASGSFSNLCCARAWILSNFSAPSHESLLPDERPLASTTQGSVLSKEQAREFDAYLPPVVASSLSNKYCSKLARRSACPSSAFRPSYASSQRLSHRSGSAGASVFSDDCSTPISCGDASAGVTSVDGSLLSAFASEST